MIAFSHKAWQARPGFLVLLFCALLLRTFVPAGFMIGPVAAGAPALVPCVDSAPMPAHRDSHGHPAPRSGESPCPYAALAAPALPPVPLLFALPVLLAPAVAESTALVALRPAPAAPPPPATGPPVSARI
jgi:hypothetical protein